MKNSGTRLPETGSVLVPILPGEGLTPIQVWLRAITFNIFNLIEIGNIICQLWRAFSIINRKNLYFMYFVRVWDCLLANANKSTADEDPHEPRVLDINL